MAFENYIAGVTYARKDDPIKDDCLGLGYPGYRKEIQGGHVFPSMSGLCVRDDNKGLQEIMLALSILQWDKEGSYGDSWCRRGEMRAIMPNIDRKYDRLDTIVKDEIEGNREPLPTESYEELSSDQISRIGESKIDAIADLANYCLLYLTYMRKKHPGAFQVWLEKNIPSDLQVRLRLLSE